MKSFSVFPSLGLIGFLSSLILAGSVYKSVDPPKQEKRPCANEKCQEKDQAKGSNVTIQLSGKNSIQILPDNKKEKNRDPKIQKEIDAITEALNHYIEGSTEGQPSRLKKVFHPKLNLYSVRKGKLTTWSGVDYIKSTKEGKPTGESGKILAIDLENSIAVAKVLISHPKSKNKYIDFFMLLKVDQNWTIVHKMYTKKNQHSGRFGDWESKLDLKNKKIKIGNTTITGPKSIL